MSGISAAGPEAGRPQDKGERGMVLAMTLFLVMGVTAIATAIMFNSRMGRMSALNYKNKIRTFAAADGMVSLLAQEVINRNAAKYLDSGRTGSIQGKIWHNLPGPGVAAFQTLTTRVRPSDSLISRYLGSQLDRSDYGIKWTGWLLPPLSGTYTFYTRSDDESRFYLSSDAEERNLPSRPTCRIEPGWVVAWPTSGTAVSQPISLVAGRRYYFEYYHKQGDGWDIGQVGWSGPDFFAERPISGSYLSRFKTEPEWSGTAQVGAVPARYRLASLGLDSYRIAAEGALAQPGRARDTTASVHLEQGMSLRGPPVPPPARLRLPVIYRDFPSDGSHPEFNPPGTVHGPFRRMVQPILTESTAVDAAYFGRNRIPKPTFWQAAPNYGCGVDKWFKDWTFDQWDYQYASPTDCRKTRFNAAGNTYQHVKSRDSLEFVLDESQGPYTYVFSRMGNFNSGNPQTSWRGEAEFFPLDFRPRDPAGTSHNYSFCMELHTTFLHQSGLKFEFTGDDDVWVFINNNMLMDLGGIHPSVSASLQLDDLTWLDYGQTYPFDLFQCERHTMRSTSRIVTNIKMGRPTGPPRRSWRRDYGNLD
jgi:fibro-slime domain-containing protein